VPRRSRSLSATFAVLAVASSAACGAFGSNDDAAGGDGGPAAEAGGDDAAGDGGDAPGDGAGDSATDGSSGDAIASCGDAAACERVVFVASVAFSAAGAAARDRFVHGTGAYVLPDGTRVANDFSAFTSGALLHPIDQDEDANAVAATVFTGTKADGTASASTCGDWLLADTASTATTGQSTSSDSSWTQASVAKCGAALSIYCVEQ